MKCPRCGNDMKREKVKEHKFRYRCVRCGYQIGAKDEEEKYTQAYTETMGKG